MITRWVMAMPPMLDVLQEIERKGDGAE